MVRRRLAAVLLTVALLHGPLPHAAAATELDWPVPNGHHYTQANGFPPGTSPMGFTIVDDDRARFWSAFQRLGGVTRLGYPATQRFFWGGFLTQVTQKAVLQWRPATGTVDFVNVFDDLSRVGRDDWLQTVRSVPRPIASTFDVGLTWPQIVAHRQSLLQTRPALLRRYLAADDPLDLYGLPASPVVDAGPMYVIRLQRAVLQEWKVKEPWANVGEVTVANGGDVAKEAGGFPPDALRPAAPPDSTWLANAQSFQLAGIATWYGPGFAGKPMKDGQIYDPGDPTTAASNAYPVGSRLNVYSTRTKKAIVVSVRDIGAFQYPDVVDLSPAAFTSLGVLTTTGVLSVTVAMVPLPMSAVISNTHAPPTS